MEQLIAGTVRNAGALDAPYVHRTPVDMGGVVFSKRAGELTISATPGTERTTITEVPDDTSLGSSSRQTHSGAEPSSTVAAPCRGYRTAEAALAVSRLAPS